MSQALLQGLNTVEERLNFDQLKNGLYEVLQATIMSGKKDGRSWEAVLLSVHSVNNNNNSGDRFSFYLPSRFGAVVTPQRVQEINRAEPKLVIDKRGTHLVWLAQPLP
jgi:hypothetical protein